MLWRTRGGTPSKALKSCCCCYELPSPPEADLRQAQMVWHYSQGGSLRSCCARSASGASVPGWARGFYQREVAQPSQALDCTGLVPKPVDMQCSHHGWPWSIPGPATDPIPSSTWNLGLTSWVRATFPCPPDHCHPILPILPMVRSHNAPTWEQRVNPSVETSGSLASHPSSFTCSCWPPSMGFSARRE